MSGTEAGKTGTIMRAVSADRFDAAVAKPLDRLAGAPKNRLAMTGAGRRVPEPGDATRRHHRHDPEGVAPKARARVAGFKQAVRCRDSGDTVRGGKNE